MGRSRAPRAPLTSGGFRDLFGAPPSFAVHAPGRVNLIGEHVDYAGRPVLPMAIDRGVTLRARPRNDMHVRLANTHSRFGEREFDVGPSIPPSPAGDWGNFAKAAVQGLARAGLPSSGFDGLVSSNLPPAAGLSSSSALVVAVALASLAAAGEPVPPEAGPLPLASLLARAEHYAGARGGGMDQAAILAGRRGRALRVEFDPLRVHAVPVPGDWSFVVADSLETAEKTGRAREVYNARRLEVERALAVAGEGSLPRGSVARRRLRHVESETARVGRAERALLEGDAAAFGRLMVSSHESLRDDFEVSTPRLDGLVEAALDAGASGARLTGAGLGGCIVALVPASTTAEFLSRLHAGWYERHAPSSGRDSAFAVSAAEGARIVSVD